MSKQIKYNYIKNTFQVEAFPSNSKVADMQMNSETLNEERYLGASQHLLFLIIPILLKN